jgi:hypothetical protein
VKGGRDVRGSGREEGAAAVWTWGRTRARRGRGGAARRDRRAEQRVVARWVRMCDVHGAGRSKADTMGGHWRWGVGTSTRVRDSGRGAGGVRKVGRSGERARWTGRDARQRRAREGGQREVRRDGMGGARREGTAAAWGQEGTRARSQGSGEDGSGMAARPRAGGKRPRAGGSGGRGGMPKGLRRGSDAETGRSTAALVGVANREHDDRAQPLDPRAGVLEVGTQGFRSGRGVLEGGFRSGVLTQVSLVSRRF